MIIVDITKRIEFENLDDAVMYADEVITKVNDTDIIVDINIKNESEDK